MEKIFSFTINKLSTTNNTFNGKPSDVLYTGYLNKDTHHLVISFTMSQIILNIKRKQMK